MTYRLFTTTRFRKSLAKCLKRGLNKNLLDEVLSILVNEGRLPKKYLPHPLQGKYSGYWECHLQPNWLLIWKQDDTQLTLLLVNTGTHSDLF